MSKRYMVFAGTFYYPSGGANDFRANTGSLRSAREIAKFESKAFDHSYSSGWAHIFDTKTLTTVERYNAGEISADEDQPAWSDGQREV